MRVLIIGTSFRLHYGGPAVSVARLAAEVGRLGIDVGVWSPDGSAASLAATGLEQARALDGPLPSALESFGVPDVIHDNGLWLPHNHRIASYARRMEIPRIVSPRGMLEPWAMRHKRLKKWIAWRAYQKRDLDRAARLHAATAVEAATVAALDIDVPVTVIPNGVDVPPLRSRDYVRPAAQKTAVFLGRVYPVKGLPLLVDAWARVRPEGWRLIIAGPDEAGHMAQVKQAVERASLSEVVSLTGPVTGEAKADLLRNATLFILPSHSESFGMAVAEALASGLPVLTTTSVPWQQLSSAGCGWRVAATPEALAGGLAIATGTPVDVLREMGGRGRAMVETEFQWRAVASRMLSLYEDARASH